MSASFGRSAGSGGAAISLSATYALGHVADRYSAQGRRLSRNDLLVLFDRFKQDAGTIYPRVQSQIQTKSGTLNVQSLLAGLRGAESASQPLDEGRPPRALNMR